jgi:hypothetical protein
VREFYTGEKMKPNPIVIQLANSTVGFISLDVWREQPGVAIALGK